MILHGNQRGGAKDLALHLMKDENERVEIFEMRGFVADTLDGAFRESYAMSRGTRCKQHLYSMSINPPADADIQPVHFVDAANRTEKCLGLDGQPRAIVFHEKRGTDGELRRHAHAVWCRVDPETMTAKQLSFDREKLREVSRELHIHHDLKMPLGLIDSKDHNPRNFTLAEWQQCKRAEKDPKQVKGVFQDAWSTSDSQSSFSHALEERGYFLAQGKRGHIAVDYKGEKYAVSRYIGIKAKQVRAKLGEADGLASVEQAQANAMKQIADRLEELRAEQVNEARIKHDRAREQSERAQAAQEKEAQKLDDQQTRQNAKEEQIRAARIRHGIKGLLDRITGQRKRTKTFNQQEAVKTQTQRHRESLDLKQEQERQTAALKQNTKTARSPHIEAARELNTDIKQLKTPQEPATNTQTKSYAEQQRENVNRRRHQRSRDGPTLSR